jgi:tRNA(fMet)-specific endonuclease VapC
MIILDSDVLIEILDRKSEEGAKAVESILASGEAVCTTVIGLHEVLFGMYKHEKPVKELLQLPALNYKN